MLVRGDMSEAGPIVNRTEQWAENSKAWDAVVCSQQTYESVRRLKRVRSEWAMKDEGGKKGEHQVSRHQTPWTQEAKQVPNPGKQCPTGTYNFNALTSKRKQVPKGRGRIGRNPVPPQVLVVRDMRMTAENITATQLTPCMKRSLKP
jgi:hypothetical protein